jgi:hypothetical protein
MKRTVQAIAVLLGCIAVAPAHAFFERIDASSRALAFGESYVALATDASGVAWNAAALGALARREVQLAVSAPYFVPDLLANAAFVALPAWGGGAGLGWHRLGNEFLAENVWFASYGRWVYRDDHGTLFLGATTKVGHVSVTAGAGEPDYGGATSFTGDVAAFYAGPRGFTAGAAVHNLGEPDVDLVDGGDATTWSTGLDAGIAYRWRPESTISGGWTSDGRSRDAWRAGGEIWFYDVFAVRAGVLGTEFAGGFGLKTDRWQLDSGFVTHAQLGLSGRVSLTVPFGGGGLGGTR